MRTFVLVLVLNFHLGSSIDVKVTKEEKLETLTITDVEITLEPSDKGLPPHKHPGPVFGRVLQGELLFQVQDEPARIIKAGTEFEEKDGKVHLWGANASKDKECKFVASVFGRPNEPLVKYVKDFEQGSYEDALAKAIP